MHNLITLHYLSNWYICLCSSVELLHNSHWMRVQSNLNPWICRLVNIYVIHQLYFPNFFINQTTSSLFRKWMYLLSIWHRCNTITILIILTNIKIFQHNSDIILRRNYELELMWFSIVQNDYYCDVLLF